MTIPAMADPCETSTPNRLNQPPVRLPKLVQLWIVFNARRCGNRSIGRTHLRDQSILGRSVVVSSLLW